MKTHKFDVEDAKKHGIEKAILLEHLKFHQEANSGNDNMVFDGKPHAFIKPKTIEKMYPYFNIRSVRRWLKELEEDGIIESIKPEKSGGYHLKYYHVIDHKIPNGQNDRSNGQDGHSLNGQNDRSSIVTNVNNHNGRESVVERLENAESIQVLFNIWLEYRKQKNKFPTLYEKETLEYKLNQWGIRRSKKIVKIAMQNGWLSLKEEYLSDSADESDLFDNNKIRRINARS